MIFLTTFVVTSRQNIIAKENSDSRFYEGLDDIPNAISKNSIVRSTHTDTQAQGTSTGGRRAYLPKPLAHTYVRTRSVLAKQNSLSGFAFARGSGRLYSHLITRTRKSATWVTDAAAFVLIS
jgi:hypothetical protein